MENNAGVIIANNIRAERGRADMSQRQVSEMLGISTRTYLKYEVDASKVSSKILVKLAEIFDCKIESFFINL